MFQNTTTHGGNDLSLYLERFKDLRHELSDADDKYDQAMDDLRNAGFTNVKLMELLADSRVRTRELERELTVFHQTSERIHKRLLQCKCLKCGKRSDASGIATAGADTSIR